MLGMYRGLPSCGYCYSGGDEFGRRCYWKENRLAFIPEWTAYRKIGGEIKHPPVVELRKSKLRQEGRFMSRTYTHVQELLPSVLAMKEEGYTY